MISKFTFLLNDWRIFLKWLFSILFCRRAGDCWYLRSLALLSWSPRKVSISQTERHELHPQKDWGWYQKMVEASSTSFSVFGGEKTSTEKLSLWSCDVKEPRSTKLYPTPIPLENQVGWPLYKTTFWYSSYVSWFCIFGRIGWTLDFLEVVFLMYLTLLQGVLNLSYYRCKM